MAQERTDRPKFRRRTLVVDRKLQLKYFALFAGIGAGLTVLWGGIAFLVRRQVEVNLGNVPGGELGLFQVAGGLFGYFLAAVVAIGCLVGLLGLLVTQRIAGPAFVVTRLLRVLSTGRYPLLRKLRKDDDLQELFAAFAGLIEALRRREQEELLVMEAALAAVQSARVGLEANASVVRLNELCGRKKQNLECPPTPPESL